MVFAYLAERAAYRILAFFRHWYIDGTRRYWHAVFEFAERIDYTLAWKVTARNLFRPLYGDGSVIGYIFGFVFRLIRLGIGSAVYALVFGVAGLGFAVWAAMPAYLAVRVIK